MALSKPTRYEQAILLKTVLHYPFLSIPPLHSLKSNHRILRRSNNSGDHAVKSFYSAESGTTPSVQPILRRSSQLETRKSFYSTESGTTPSVQPHPPAQVQLSSPIQRNRYHSLSPPPPQLAESGTSINPTVSSTESLFQRLRRLSSLSVQVLNLTPNRNLVFPQPSFSSTNYRQ